MNLPWEVLDTCNGFSVDIGYSAMKFVYIDKNDWKEPEQREKGSRGKLCITSFPNQNLDTTEAFDFIDKAVYLKKQTQSPVIYGTGFGTSVLAEKFKEVFGVTVQCEDEYSCFTHALAYLAKQLPRKEILYRFATEEEESFFAQGKAAYETSLAMRCQITTKSDKTLNGASPDDLFGLQNSVNATLDKPLATENNMFPCILVMCGSGFGSLLVAEDGSCEVINVTPIGGRFWSGIGSILTNAQNYHELMALAEKGNHANVDLVIADVLANMRVDKGQDFYQDLLVQHDTTDTRTIFSFAKVNQETKGGIKQEDLARAMLQSLVINTVHLGLNSARIVQARHVFYTGGFVSHPLVQKMMYRQWVLNWCETAGATGRVDPIAVHFLQQGSHLGALGALLRNLRE